MNLVLNSMGIAFGKANIVKAPAGVVPRGRGVRSLMRQLVRVAMAQLKVTQAEIAEASGYAPSTFSLLLCGHYEPRSLQLKDLGHVLDGIETMSLQKRKAA